MIPYNPGYWSICFAFSLKGSVFPKAFVWAAGSAAFAVLLRLLIDTSDGVKDSLAAGGSTTSSLMTGFTFILGFLVVFRSQTAYSRWWEGGTLMQQVRGEWFNAASNLVAFCSRDETRRDEVLKFQHQLVRLVSLLYASALQQICTMEDRCFYLIDIDGFDKKSLEFLQSDDCHDHCEVVLQWIQRLIVLADSEGIIKVAPPILSRVYNQLGNGIVNLTNARKITEFPIPFPLAQMIAVMLLIHWFVIPLTCATAVDSTFWAGFLTFVVVFSFWTINYIATELEMPFGDDPNDLPLHEMQSDLNASLTSLLQDRALSCPDFKFDPKFDCKMQQVKVNPSELATRDDVAIPLAGAVKKKHGSIRMCRRKAWKHETKKGGLWDDCCCLFFPRKKEDKLESAPILKDDTQEHSRQDGSAPIATLGCDSYGHEDDVPWQPARYQEYSEAAQGREALVDSVYHAVDKDQGGISPSHVGVPAYFSTEASHEALGGVVANPLASADIYSGGDAFLQSSVYHCHYHHHHRIEMEQGHSNALPAPSTNRGAQNALGDSCCMQFVSPPASTTPIQLPTLSSQRALHLDVTSQPSNITSSAYRALQQTVV